MSVAAVVLAAGGSSRLGEPKQLLVDRHGETLVHKVARDALDAGYAPVCVVIGAHGMDVRAAVADLPVLVAENANWLEGLSTSIRCGLNAVLASSTLPVGRIQDIGNVHVDGGGQTLLNVKTQRTSFDGIDGLLMLTCDMPSVGRAHLELMLETFEGDLYRVASRYGATVGVPAIFLTEDFPALLSLEGDAGAKKVLLSGAVTGVALPGGTFDLDTPEDVAAWRAAQAL